MEKQARSQKKKGQEKEKRRNFERTGKKEMKQSQRARAQSSQEGEEVHFRKIDDLQSVGINVSDIKKVKKKHFDECCSIKKF